MKAVLVTGGAHRLGRHITLALAQAGWNVVLHYNSSKEKAEETCAQAQKFGVKCVAIAADLAAPETPEYLMAQALDAFPELCALVNCASAYIQSDIANTTMQDFDYLHAVNIRAPFFLTQQFAIRVQAGSIINIIDNKVSYNQFAYSAYLLAKKSLEQLTYMSALEFAPRIRVNGISPGVVLPAESRSPEYIAWRVQTIPLQKKGSPDDICSALLFLLEQEFITGQVLTVDGGEGIDFTGKHAAAYTLGADIQK
jgi:pteridine reductase